MELSTLLAVVQEMGQRLANETHGDSYYLVEELNEILHQARLSMKGIKSAQRKGGANEAAAGDGVVEIPPATK